MLPRRVCFGESITGSDNSKAFGRRGTWEKGRELAQICWRMSDTAEVQVKIGDRSALASLKLDGSEHL